MWGRLFSLKLSMWWDILNHGSHYSKNSWCSYLYECMLKECMLNDWMIEWVNTLSQWQSLCINFSLLLHINHMPKRQIHLELYILIQIRINQLLIFTEKLLPLPGFETETSSVPNRYATNWAILAWITTKIVLQAHTGWINIGSSLKLSRLASNGPMSKHFPLKLSTAVDLI